MDEKNQPPDKDNEREETTKKPRSGDAATDIRKANQNIRKSQGDDAGQRPVIDRHR